MTPPTRAPRTQTANSRKRENGLLLLWGLLVAMLLLGPFLQPGSPLRYDLVAVPDPVLTPGTWGGQDLPRAVPLDAAVWLLSRLTGAYTWQIITLGMLLAAGYGLAQLGPESLAARMVIVVAAQANPWVVEQLGIGHVPHLFAYAAIPWVVRHLFLSAAKPPSEQPWSPLIVAVGVIAGSLTPGGGVLVVAVVFAATWALWRSGLASKTVGLAWSALALLAQVPWILAGLLVRSMDPPSPDLARASVEAFGLREVSGWWLTDALSLAGMWNASAVVPSRQGPGIWLTFALTVVVLFLGYQGLMRATAQWPAARTAAAVLTACSMLIAGWVHLPGGFASLSWLQTASAAFSIFRDGHRWLLVWALLWALLAGYALQAALATVQRRAARHHPPKVRQARFAAVAVLGIAMVVATVPDAWWGARGAWSSQSYPDDFAQVREVIHADARRHEGYVLVLPWQAFRRFDWAHGSVVLDPALRWFDAPMLTSDRLMVDGSVVAQERPLTSKVAALLEREQLDAEELRAVGVRWVLVEHQTPGMGLMRGPAPKAYEGSALSLYGPFSGRIDPMERAGMVRSAQLSAWGHLSLFVVAGIGISVTLRRRRMLKVVS